jgi:hypothetical protein
MAETIESFIEKIDFKLLKKQKHQALKTLDKMESNPKFSKKERDSLEGIINLIDEVQRIAVDEQGLKENVVFRITRG